MLSLLRNKYGFLAILPCITGLATAAVNLKPDNGSFCPGSTAMFVCNTTMGSLLWETSSTTSNHVFNNPTQSSSTLGIFQLHLDGISQINTSGTVKAVNSTAVVSDVLLSYDGISLKCSEYADLSIFSETILRVKGPPPAPAVNPITVVDEGSIKSTLLISWSQSNCAVQYVVTIINSSDDRVYPNIATSNTNTTVTLPTGVEFCVTLVGVDSIGRRGPDTTPVCYQFNVPGEVSTTIASDTVTILTTAKAATLMLTPSPTVTHSPGMMGGVNVAAAVAVPVVLVLLLLLVIGVVVVGVSYYLLCHHKRQGQVSLEVSIPLQRKKVQVFSREDGVNNWKIVCATCWETDNFSVKEHSENNGYTAHGEPVDVLVTSDEEILSVTVQSVTTGWSVEQLQDSKAEVGDQITDENKPLCTTTTFIVSSSQTSPQYDMCVSVTINGGQTPHTVTVVRKAIKKYACQVFYHWEGINCWKVTFAFFSEHLLNRVEKLYQNILNGPKVDFYLCKEANDIDLSTNCETSMWHIVEGSKSPQVSRAAVEGYTGEGEPPCIVMTLKPKSDETKPSNLTLPVTLTGVREQSNIIVIERRAEDRTWHVCQVFYHKIGVNHWTATLAFCHKKKLNKVREHYQNAADIGPIIDIDHQISSLIFDIDVNYSNTMDGWKIDSNKQCKVSRESITRYGEGEPPCIVMTLRAVSDEITPPNLTLPITITEVNEVNKNVILIERTAEDPTGCVCQVFYHKKDSNNWTVTLAFCQRKKFDKMKEIYQEDAYIGPTIDVKFKTTSHIAPNIRKVTGGWTLVPDNQLKQVSRAAVEGYTGEGEPPCIVMTLIATNKTVSIDANFTVTLDGVQPPNTITITRSPDAANFQMEASTDDDDRFSESYAVIDITGCVCQVFYLKKNSNIWIVTFAFCIKNKIDKMKEYYQDAEIGPDIDINFIPTSDITPNIGKVIEGWTLVPDNKLKKVSRAAVEGYTGEGEPPCIVMTLTATNKTVSTDANFTVTLDGVQPPNTITINRSPDPANFQTETSTDVDDRFSRSDADTDERKAEKDSDTKSGQSSTTPPLFRYRAI